MTNTPLSKLSSIALEMSSPFVTGGSGGLVGGPKDRIHGLLGHGCMGRGGWPSSAVWGPIHEAQDTRGAFHYHAGRSGSLISWSRKLLWMDLFLVSLSGGATLDIESHRACGEDAHENLAKVPLWLCKDIGLLPSLLPASVLDDHRNPQVRSFSRHEFVQE